VKRRRKSFLLLQRMEIFLSLLAPSLSLFSFVFSLLFLFSSKKRQKDGDSGEDRTHGLQISTLVIAKCKCGGAVVVGKEEEEEKKVEINASFFFHFFPSHPHRSPFLSPFLARAGARVV
jgi:hypothetical protein